MKKFIGIFFYAILFCSCGNGKTETEQKQYIDSLFNVISSSPSVVDGPYTLENQLEACDLLIMEYPDRKEQFEEIKESIQLQIKQRDAEESIYDF